MKRQTLHLVHGAGSGAGRLHVSAPFLQKAFAAVEAAYSVAVLQ
jgi:hypothetical protein